jgi:hypothetical protein
VLGATWLEDAVRQAIDMIRSDLGDDVQLYQVGATRCAVLIEDAPGRDRHAVASRLDASCGKRSPVRAFR